MKHIPKSLVLFAVPVIFSGSILFASVASAHVKVTPASVGVASYQTFTLSVPNEREGLTTGVRVEIPSGVTNVTPTIQTGWKLLAKKSGQGKDAPVTEIEWTGGIIPAGQRDEFTFSAKVPGTPTSLHWKAYQTYNDGTVISWDAAPAAAELDNDAAATGPYSITQVIDDATPVKTPGSPLTTVSIVISVLALGVSFYALRRPQ
jgi:uncharacterized protein YcnI